MRDAFDLDGSEPPCLIGSALAWTAIVATGLVLGAGGALAWLARRRA